MLDILDGGGISSIKDAFPVRFKCRDLNFSRERCLTTMFPEILGSLLVFGNLGETFNKKNGLDHGKTGVGVMGQAMLTHNFLTN